MCKCQECGINYSVDIMVSNDIWKQISPKPKTKEGGLLCAKCIGKKIEEISGYTAYKLIQI